jgi:hypothetical protein
MSGYLPPGCTQDECDRAQGGYFDAPLVEVACGMCGGEGHIVKGDWVYESGCGFGHADSYEVPCENCSGLGFFLCEAEGDLP